MRAGLQFMTFFAILTIHVGSAQHELDCGDGVFTNSSGFIHLPTNPTDHSVNINCTYTILANNNSVISLGVFSSELPSLLDSFVDCNRDYITVGCVSETETELKQDTSITYCSHSFDFFSVHPSRIIFSNCSTVKIFVRASDYNYRESYAIPFTVFSAYDEDCGTTFFTDPTGFVNSPRFPLSYPHSLDCVYSIYVDRTKTITFYFLSFTIEGPSEFFFKHDLCWGSWVTVGCLLDDGSVWRIMHPDWKFCSEKAKPWSGSLYDCEYLIVNFVSNSSVNKGDFQLQYAVTSPENTPELGPEKDRVNATFTGPTGFITSPQFPLSYPINVDYYYSIDVDRTKVVGLYFHSFSLEAALFVEDPHSCQYDVLIISCLSETSSSRRVIRYCGEKPEQPILSFSKCESLTLNFFSDSSVTRGGFKIWYSIGQSGCGKTLHSGPNGVVTSPNFPLPYPQNHNCTYSINVAQKSSVLLRFEYFEMEGPDASGDCGANWLLITCNETSKTNPKSNLKYCGDINWTSSMRFVDCSRLVLKFSSGFSYYRKSGFMISYTVTENVPQLEPEKDRVNATFTGPTGFITSPRFPLSYPNNIDYIYSINVDPTKVVGLYFYSFSLEAALFAEDPHSCYYDFLLISCLSETPAFHWVIRYCGEKPEQPIRSFSKCESLTLNFFSDSSVTRGGFKIWYSIGQSDCGKTLHSGPNGVVTSPNFPLPYPQNLNCTYSINVAQKSSVLLRFEYFEMEGPDSSGDCGTSWLLITCCDDTSKTNPKSNLKYCGDINWTSSMRFVDCSCLVLKFSSGFSYYSKSGFMILYTVIENSKSTAEDPGMNPTELDCGATLFTDSSGEIILPRNSMNYLATVNCTYTITINQRSIIWLNASLDEMIPLLQSFQDCGRQRIVVGCVSEGETEPNPNKSMILCRGWSSADYDTRRELVFPDCRMLKLFIFSNTYDYRGTFDIPFSVEQQNLDCGTTLFTNYSGVIILPRNPTNHLTSVYCTYTISANHLSYISLDTGPSSSAQWFQSFQNCEREHVMISCVPDADTDLNTYTTRIFCGDYRFPDDNLVVFVECRTLKLNVQSSTYANTQTIRIPFFVVGPDNVCGITSFSAPTGVVSTPQKLPYQYRKRYNCLYTIDIGQVNSIVLSVDRLDMNRFSFFFGSFCNDDWLKITCFVNGTWVDHPLADRKICGNVHGDFWTTTARFPACHSVLLNFTTYSIASGMGYGIRYRIGDYELDCGTTLFTNSSGVISIPGNPTDIPAKMNCTYTISANRMSDIWLQFYATRSILQSLQDCNTESLTFGCISEGESELNPNTSRVFCTDGKPVKGRDLPEVDAVFADCRTVKLSIRSYAYINRETFSIPFSVYETSKTAAMSVSTEIPFIESVECDVGCEINEDGTNCVCSTTHSEDVVASTQTNLSEEEPGRPSVKSVIIISLACVPPVVTLVAVCIVRS